MIANVVGTMNPKYTLIGDTVNTSSRMESNSRPGRILCSPPAANILREQAPEITVVSRGMIDVKGKGVMEAFGVTRGGEPDEENHSREYSSDSGGDLGCCHDC